MNNDEFQDNAKVICTKQVADKKVIPLRAQGTAPVYGLRPPSPKPPFGMPYMPVAINLKPLPAVVKEVVSDAKKTEETRDE